jgi:hypothetical protein
MMEVADPTLKEPRIFKSHLPVSFFPPRSSDYTEENNPNRDKKVKYVYVARNGKDVAVSMFHHARG